MIGSGRHIRRIGAIAVLGQALALCLGSPMPIHAASARDADAPWTIHGRVYGEPDASDPGRIAASGPSTDVSGIACASETDFPRLCLIADDESQGVQIVILRAGDLVAGSAIRLIDAAHKGKPLELDAEGVAYADGAFYVIASHRRARHAQDDPKKAARNAAKNADKNADKAEATRSLFRIRFAPGSVDPATGILTGAPQIDGTRALSRFIQDQPALRSAFDKPLEDGGVTIEGVAVRDGRLHAGFRGPVLSDGSAAILSVPLDALFDGKPGTGRLATVPLGSDSRGIERGVRDLVAVGDGLLILAGPMLDPQDDAVADGDYAIFRWTGGAATERLQLRSYGTKVKPEAVLPLGLANGALRALVLFDGPETGAPRPVEIPWP